ncbi:hypothetical protein HOLleu_39396 [Holothuria leucospilota]|uniref:Uncharacterized protein n=1 Tax=Holothuria leucospilota TaxID=206669 RepID=A0A9Q1BE30_HOLLE|nr:hypothetical protein HOLleu_39396 [Holothuria leucospilota]
MRHRKYVVRLIVRKCYKAGQTRCDFADNFSGRTIHAILGPDDRTQSCATS